MDVQQGFCSANATRRTLHAVTTTSLAPVSADPEAEADVEAATARPRRRWFRRVLIGGPVLVVLYLVITLVQVWNADGWDDTHKADAAVVLGAAQYNGRPSAAFRGRLDRAVDLYERKVVPKVVVTGGRQVGDRFTEATAGYSYLRKRGIPDANLIRVPDGASTWESLAASVRVLRQRGVRQVLLVSDPYHSFRLEGIADEVGMSGVVSPTSRTSSTRELLRETALVAVGRIIGYRRLVRLTG